MNKENTRRKWIDAAIALGKDPNEVVSCPECDIGILKVKDVPIKEWKKTDRYLICDTYGKYNVLTMSDPENQ